MVGIGQLMIHMWAMHNNNMGYTGTFILIQHFQSKHLFKYIIPQTKSVDQHV